MIHLFDTLDSIKAYIENITFDKIVALFWFLFFIEIPRYYLLDIIVLTRRWVKRKSLFRRDAMAKARFLLDRPFVSVIVPGKNEGKHIYKLARSLKEQTYRNFELVIVDDGSDDFTAVICRSLEKQGLIDRFYSMQDRGGKASAANMALFNNRAKFIVHLDADSSLDSNAIEELLIPFYHENKNVGAVGGCVKVRNAYNTMCTSMQSLEYLQSIMLGRTVTSDLKLFRTISGAFGAFRSDVLKQVGYWDIGPGLDGDITQKIRKSGYDVVFTHKAVCMTNVPEKFFNLYKQRLRWSKSLIRFRLRKHKNVLNFTHANFRILNFLTNFDNLMFGLVFDLIWVYYMIRIIIQNDSSLVELFALKFIIMLPLSLLSFLMIMILTERKREEFALIATIPLQTLYSGYFLRIIRIIASIKEFFFFSSYADSWNPTKSSKHARVEGM